MNRFVRISVTLFASASVMIFLVLQRLERAKTLVGNARDSEIQMAYVGICVAGLMLLGGVALLITGFVRSRKNSAGHGHG